MKTLFHRASISAGLCVLTVFFAVQTRAVAAPADAKAKVYDESLDGSRQIAQALSDAKKGNKRVLLQFGANWCGWCIKLHHLFQSDAAVAKQLESGYVVAFVDVNNGHNKDVDAKYGNPTRFGLPVLVVLDADGKQLTTKDSGELEEGDHHSPDKVLAFLKQWSAQK